MVNAFMSHEKAYHSYTQFIHIIHTPKTSKNPEHDFTNRVLINTTIQYILYIITYII